MTDWYENLRIDAAAIVSFDWKAPWARRDVSKGTFATQSNTAGTASCVEFMDADTGEQVRGTTNDLYAIYWHVGDEVYSIRRERR